MSAISAGDTVVMPYHPHYQDVDFTVTGTYKNRETVWIDIENYDDVKPLKLSVKLEDIKKI